MTKREIETVSDVIIRFLAHEQYGSPAKATMALSKRLGAEKEEPIDKIFERHCNIFEVTKELVTKKLSNSHFKDSLFDKLQKQIAKQTNSQTDEAGAYINWCYFFYVLK